MWGICLKGVEFESFVKSFVLFFFSQAILVGALFFMQYKKEVSSLDDALFSEMRICSFDLECPEFEIDFSPYDQSRLYHLVKTSKRLSSFFTIAGSAENMLEIFLTTEQYEKKVQMLQSEIVSNFIMTLLVVLLLSALFSLYTITPLRNALRLTEEFIKDILHDFNTPLSTLRLNVSMLKSELPQNSKIRRIESSVQNILNLQQNLRAYLHNHKAQKEKFSLLQLLEERVELIDKNFRDISFVIESSTNVTIETNREAFERIIDNLLSNAAKYNKTDGMVYLRVEKNKLEIEDTGKGIKNPKRVFERFYKEQDRGIGIGLHIVKKLSEELGITIELASELEKGTTFFLSLENLLILR